MDIARTSLGHRSAKKKLNLQGRIGKYVVFYTKGSRACVVILQSRNVSVWLETLLRAAEKIIGVVLLLESQHRVD